MVVSARLSQIFDIFRTQDNRPFTIIRTMLLWLLVVFVHSRCSCVRYGMNYYCDECSSNCYYNYYSQGCAECSGVTPGCKRCKQSSPFDCTECYTGHMYTNFQCCLVHPPSHQQTMQSIAPRSVPKTTSALRVKTGTSTTTAPASVCIGGSLTRRGQIL